MREIKFRAWHTKVKAMFYPNNEGEFIGDVENERVCSDFNYTDLLQTEAKTNYVPMQFTGLKDKKGKDVYHNDLLKGFGKQWIVEWQNEEARFLLLPSKGNSDSWKFMDEVNRMGLIGNIYENPDLLQ